MWGEQTMVCLARLFVDLKKRFPVVWLHNDQTTIGHAEGTRFPRNSYFILQVLHMYAYYMSACIFSNAY